MTFFCCNRFQFNAIRQRISCLHNTSHSIRVVLKQDLRAVTGFGTLSECKVLELCRNRLFRIVATVVHDIRVGVHNQTDIICGFELILQTNQQLLSGFEISLTRYDIECNVLDRTVRGLLVLLFVLLVQCLDLTLAHFDEAVRYRIIRLHYVLGTHTVLTTVESELSIQRVSLDQVLEKIAVFLLQIADTNGFLPVEPIGLSLLEVGILLCIVTAFIDSGDQALHHLAAILTVLVHKRTTTTQNLVNVLTHAEFGQLVCGDVHTDLLSLRTQGIVHNEHVPYLITDLGIHVFVKIRTTALNLVHFS